ncbi:MAG TPA: methylenetetrahydrofolate reductase [Acidimicrobiales bacterium]|nr:methylenetetrahydrofolate reductase [Acidimicrobiales bacterium]
MTTTAPPGRKVSDLLAAGPTLSFEFFPPRTDEAERQLEKVIQELAPLRPSFVSVTYGAGGSTRDRTRDLVVRVDGSQPFPAMPHLTCAGHTRGQVTELLDEYAAAGIHNILALAGDPPADGSEPGGDFTYATELVELVRGHPGDFSVGVAAHPELHPRSHGDRAADRRHLAAKLALADFGITQFFFDAGDYLRMVDELADLGCTTPVLPGIMPPGASSLAGLERMAAMNGSVIPPALLERLGALADDPAALRDDIERRLNAVRSPFRTAERFGVEEIIDPRDTRPILCDWAERAHELVAHEAGDGPKRRGLRP